MFHSFKLQINKAKRGSITVLAVVALALMVSLAAIFLQMAKTQRRPVIQTSNIDLVQQSVEDLIAATITSGGVNGSGDLFDSNGVFFGSGVEPYDYPWTNPSTGGHNQFAVYGLNGTTLGNSYGGFNDDMWLASSYVELRGGNYIWPHITNLTGVGIYPTSPNNDGTSLANKQFTENPINPRSGNVHQYDTGLHATNLTTAGSYEFMVDVDGDGIRDSRWERAPLPFVEDVQYFMAVRIVDLSSMVNINIASGSTPNTLATDDDNYSAVTLEQPRGTTPSSINFNRLALKRDVVGALGYIPQDLNGARANGGSLDPTDLSNSSMDYDRLPYTDNDPTNFSDQFDLWHQHGRYWNAGAGISGAATPTRATWDTEWMFRIHNGVGAADGYAPITGYTSFVAQAFDNWIGDNGHADLSATYEDYLTNAGFPLTNLDEYFSHNARVNLTTINGSANFVMPAAVTATGGNFPSDGNTRLATNLNTADVRKENPNIAELAFRLIGNEFSVANNSLVRNVYQVFDAESFSSAPTAYTYPLTIASHPLYTYTQANLSADFPNTDAFVYGMQLAANLRDYMDSDNLMTVIDYDARDGDAGNISLLDDNNVYGMEAWPALTEVYTQRLYEADSTGSTPAPSDFYWDITWRQASNAAYVIEIRNPYNRPISLANIRVYLSSAAGPEVLLTDPVDPTLTTLAEIADSQIGERELDVNEVLFLVLEDTDATNNVASLIDTTEIPTWYSGTQNALTINVAGAWPNDPDTDLTTSGLQPADVSVELRVLRLNGDRTLRDDYYTFSRIDSYAAPDEFEVTTDYSLANDPNQQVDYLQFTTYGSGNGLNAIAHGNAGASGVSGSGVGGSALVVPFMRSTPIQPQAPDATSILPATRDTTFDRLGQLTKGATEPFADNNQQLIIADYGPIGLQYAGELALISALAPQPLSAGSPRLRSVNDVLSSITITDIEDLLMDLDEPQHITALPSNDRDSWLFNRAQILLSRVTTIDTNSDSLDNDGDTDIDETDEQLVPGKINLNTIHPDVLADVLPWPSEYTETNLLAQIIKEYADDPSTRNGHVNDANHVDPATATERSLTTYGLQNIWELWPVLKDNGVFTTGGATTAVVPVGDGSDTQTLSTGATVDWNNGYANPADPAWPLSADTRAPLAEIGISDGISDDREEKLMLLNWLSQFATTRSDVFCAYIRIDGYEHDPNKTGTTTEVGSLVETQRSIVVFSRANIVEPTDKPEVLGRFIFP